MSKYDSEVAKFFANANHYGVELTSYTSNLIDNLQCALDNLDNLIEGLNLISKGTGMAIVGNDYIRPLDPLIVKKYSKNEQKIKKYVSEIKKMLETLEELNETH